MLVAQLVNNTTPVKIENFVGNFSAGQVIDSSFLPASSYPNSTPMLGVLQSDLIANSKCPYPVIRLATRGYLAIKIGDVNTGAILEVGGLFSLLNGFAVPLGFNGELIAASTTGGGNLIIDAIVYGYVLVFINGAGAPTPPVIANIYNFLAGVETAPASFNSFSIATGLEIVPINLNLFLIGEEISTAQIPFYLNESETVPVGISSVGYDGGAATVNINYLLIERDSAVAVIPYLLIEQEFINVKIPYFLNESEYVTAIIELLLVETEKVVVALPRFIDDTERAIVGLPYYLNATEYVFVDFIFFEAERDLRPVIIQESIALYTGDFTSFHNQFLALYTSNFICNFELSQSNNFISIN